MKASLTDCCPVDGNNKSQQRMEHCLQSAGKNQCQPRMFDPLELLKKCRWVTEIADKNIDHLLTIRLYYWKLQNEMKMEKWQTGAAEIKEI